MCIVYYLFTFHSSSLTSLVGDTLNAVQILRIGHGLLDFFLREAVHCLIV